MRDAAAGMRFDDSAVDSMNRSLSEEKGKGRAHRIGYGTPSRLHVKWHPLRVQPIRPRGCGRSSSARNPGSTAGGIVSSGAVRSPGERFSAKALVEPPSERKSLRLLADGRDRPANLPRDAEGPPSSAGLQVRRM